MLHPYHPEYDPGRVRSRDASSPARWAEMANELLGDPAIASRYQIWFFIYNSGNPIALSAMRLRESLQAVRKDVDPDGKDPALNQMVVIGHSQGGLLTKMTSSIAALASGTMLPRSRLIRRISTPRLAICSPARCSSSRCRSLTK